MRIISRTAYFQNAKKVNDKRAINGSNWAFNENTFLTAPHRAHRAYQMATNGMGFMWSRLYDGWLRYDWITTSRRFDWLHKNIACIHVIAEAFAFLTKLPV